MKVLKFKPYSSNEINELKELLNKEEYKAFAFVGLKSDGDVSTFVSSTSTLELCGMLSFLEKDIKNQIEI